MRPKLFERHLVPHAIFRKRRKLHSGSETVRHIAMGLSRHLAVTALGFADQGKGDELASYSRISRS